MRNVFAPGGIARRGLLCATLRMAGGVALLGAAIRTAAADGTEIHVDNFKFAPTPLTVPKGTTVTWIDPRRHSPQYRVPGAGVSFASQWTPMEASACASISPADTVRLRVASVHARAGDRAGLTSSPSPRFHSVQVPGHARYLDECLIASETPARQTRSETSTITSG